MQRPAKSSKAIPAAGFLVLLILGFAGQAFADKKPKFVYVANSGDSFPGDQLETFQVTATATCSNYPCASTLSISGSFTLDAGLGILEYGTMYLTDSNDVASSPLPVMSAFQPNTPVHSPTPTPLYYNTDGSFYEGGPLPSSITLVFPFTTFPANYSGGPLCTNTSVPGCAGISGISIGTANMSPSLRATTGGTPVTGTIVSGSVTLVANTQGSHTVSGYAIDATTGALTPVPGSPFAAGSTPYSVAVDPSSKFIYVANRLSNNISAFAVNGMTGALSQIPGSPFPAGSDPDWVAVDPLGKFVYVTNQRSNNISAYTMDSETGVLTSINGSPFPTALSPVSLTVDPLGRFVYVTNSDRYNPDFNLSAYTVDSITGTLTALPGSPFVAPVGAIETAEDPSGKFLFQISQFNPWWGVGVSGINGSTGGLTYTPYGNGLDWPSALAVHPSGKFLYIIDDLSKYVAAFTIDSATGNLAIVAGSPYGDNGREGAYAPAGLYATGSMPESIAIDPSGKFAYVGNMYSNNISAFAIDGTTGALAPIAGSPFAAGVGPASVAIASASTVPFADFKVKADIDEDRKTSFRVAGFFTLGKGSDGIYPLSENVELQVGSFTATVPTGSFRQEGRHEFEFEGRINDVELKITIYPIERKGHKEGKDFLFTAGGNGNILAGTANPVTVGLTIGDDEGSTTVKADIEK